MRKIKSTGTQIEKKLESYLEKSQIEFEQQPKMFGKPDFFVRPNIVVFCDSSFWHGKNWKQLQRRLPSQYWYEHISQNRRRDRLVNRKLGEEGYIVLRFWDSEIEKKPERCILAIREAQDRTNAQNGDYFVAIS